MVDIMVFKNFEVFIHKLCIFLSFLAKKSQRLLRNMTLSSFLWNLMRKCLKRDYFFIMLTLRAFKKDFVWHLRKIRINPRKICYRKLDFSKIFWISYRQFEFLKVFSALKSSLSCKVYEIHFKNPKNFSENKIN